MAFVHKPPDPQKLLTRQWRDVATLRRVFDVDVSDGEYLHWDQIRHRDPPGSLTREEWWARLKLGRGYTRFPLVGVDGVSAKYSTPPKVLELLHFIDQHCAGEIAMEEAVVRDDQVRHRYVVNSLMEEAIRSSQLEGATTSRRRAKQLLESGDTPADRSELMIYNNYAAMLFVRELGAEISPQHILELHRVVTDGTLRDPGAAGRLQLPNEQRVAVYERKPGGRLLHSPPPAEQLPERLEAMCAFANGHREDGEFIHPVVRAILLHYWLGYDHPFEDGNGRTARALFYWSMRTQGYWLVEYLSISRILREAPSAYSNAYLYSETDENDATYFLIHQLEVIRKAVGEMHDYLNRKVAEVKEVESLLRSSDELNHRQIALLSHAMRNADARYSFAGHAASHGVTHETARNDITELERRHFLDRRRGGRRHEFLASPDLHARLRA